MGGIFVLKFCVEYVFFYLVNDYFFDCFLESGNGVFQEVVCYWLAYIDVFQFYGDSLSFIRADNDRELLGFFVIFQNDDEVFRGRVIFCLA